VKSQAEQVLALIKMMPQKQIENLAWLLQAQQDDSRDRLGNRCCLLHKLTGGKFRVVHEMERERMIDSFEDEKRRLHAVRENVQEEWGPPAIVGMQVKDGGDKGRQLGGFSSKESVVRSAWERIHKSKPEWTATEIREQIVNDRVACLRTVKEHTRDLAKQLPKKRRES
jgi:hypothetical protein